VWWLAVEDPSTRASSGGFSPGAVLRASWNDVLALVRNRSVRQAMVLYAGVHFALGATSPQMESFVEAVWRSERARVEGLTGMLFSVLALAAIVATPAWGRFGDRWGHAPALRIAGALTAFSLGLHALVPSYAWLFAVRLSFGLVSPGASTAAFGLAATETEREQRGAAMGAVFSARCFAISAGSFLGGALAAGLGLRGLFLAAGAVIALGLLVGRD
jgi:MFS family permease